MRLLAAIVIIMLAITSTGCIVPVPHQRLHAYGVKGTVIDSQTGQPISGASIVANQSKREFRSDAQGRFTVDRERGWHGAFLISALSLSLLPAFDVCDSDRQVEIYAAGYEPRTVCFDRSREGDLMDTDPQRVRATVDGDYLKPAPIRLTRIAEDRDTASPTGDQFTRQPNSAMEKATSVEAASAKDADKK